MMAAIVDLLIKKPQTLPNSMILQYISGYTAIYPPPAVTSDMQNRELLLSSSLVNTDLKSKLNLYPGKSKLDDLGGWQRRYIRTQSPSAPLVTSGKGSLWGAQLNPLKSKSSPRGCVSSNFSIGVSNPSSIFRPRGANFCLLTKG